ncbi:MAG: hypothetical protein QXJ27_07515, partial [Thermoplasmata archaeon]
KVQNFMSILKRETLIGELPRKRGRREIERMAHIAMIGLIMRHLVRIQLGTWMYGRKYLKKRCVPSWGKWNTLRTHH